MYYVKIKPYFPPKSFFASSAPVGLVADVCKSMKNDTESNEKAENNGGTTWIT